MPSGKNVKERKGRAEDGTCVERIPPEPQARWSCRCVWVLERGLGPGDYLRTPNTERDISKSLTPSGP